MTLDQPPTPERLLTLEAEGLRARTERELVKQSLIAVVRSSPHVDRFASWLLGGSAVTVALVVSNLDSVAPYLELSALRTAILLSIVAAGVGVAEKAIAVWLEGQSVSVPEIFASTEALLDGHLQSELQLESQAQDMGVSIDATVRIERVVEEIATTLGGPTRWFLPRTVRKATADPLWSFKLLARALQLQSALALLEALALLAAAAALGCGIRS